MSWTKPLESDVHSMSRWLKKFFLKIWLINLQHFAFPGTCFCAGKGEGFAKQKVLYCFGEAVIERQNIRDEDDEATDEELEVFYLQLAQMMVILFSLFSV